MHQADVHYLFVREVAEILRVSPAHVRNMIHAGEIPFIRIGRTFKVPVTYLGWSPPESEGYKIEDQSTQLELW